MPNSTRRSLAESITWFNSLLASKPTLSPTKISTYLACPLKYRWTYVDERARWFLKSKRYFSFGATLHKVLQRFHDRADVGVATTYQALGALEENWLDAGYSSAQEMQEALGDGKEIISAYVDRELALPTTAKTKYVEKLLKIDLGPYILVGRLDRVDECDDGSLEIVDYKSGRLAVSDDEVAGDLAMSCYQLLLKHLHPECTVKATILALKTGNKASYSMSDVELEEFRCDLIVLGTEILHRDFFEAAPRWKPICGDCDFTVLCRRHQDFDEPLTSPPAGEGGPGGDRTHDQAVMSRSL